MTSPFWTKGGHPIRAEHRRRKARHGQPPNVPARNVSGHDNPRSASRRAAKDLAKVKVLFPLDRFPFPASLQGASGLGSLTIFPPAQFAVPTEHNYTPHGVAPKMSESGTLPCCDQGIFSGSQEAV